MMKDFESEKFSILFQVSTKFNNCSIKALLYIIHQHNNKPLVYNKVNNSSLFTNHVKIYFKTTSFW